MAEISEYPLGTVVTVFGEWDVDSAPEDPTVVKLWVQNPAGVETIYTYPTAPVERTSKGRYEADIEPTAAGIWKYRWEGTGLATGAQEGEFYIQPGLVGADEYTYDPATVVGEVRLLIDDRDLSKTNVLPYSKRSVIFTDAEINVFLARAAANVLSAAALALITIAGNRNLLVQRRTIGKTDVDFGSLRADLLKQAEAFQKQAVSIGVDIMAPADGIAEQAWTEAGARDIIANRVLRGAL